jgi:hypothetical protein
MIAHGAHAGRKLDPWQIDIAQEFDIREHRDVGKRPGMLIGPFVREMGLLAAALQSQDGDLAFVGLGVADRDDGELVGLHVGVVVHAHPNLGFPCERVDALGGGHVCRSGEMPDSEGFRHLKAARNLFVREIVLDVVAVGVQVNAGRIELLAHLAELF